jgi:hypothetical protein
LIVAALASLLVAGGVAAVALVNRNGVATVATGATSTSPTTTAIAKPSKKGGFATPAVIGPYSRSVDRSLAVAAARAIKLPVLLQVAVEYNETADPSHQLLVVGGFAELDDPSGELTSGLAEAAAAHGAKATDQRDASTGAVGGVAQCLTLDQATTHLVVCAWIGFEPFVEMAFINEARATADALVPIVLDAVLT